MVCAGFFSFSALGVFLPVLPRYVERRLGGGDIAVGVAVGAMAVGAVILRPLAGRIGDRFGRKVLMVGGAALLASMAAIAGLVEALPWLIGTRVLLGLGEAAFFIGATTMATDLAPEDRRGEAVSYFSVAVWGGLAVGPVIGEMVLDHSHYARVWITGAALALVAALISATMKETRTVHASGDLERGRLIHPAAIRPGVLLAATVVGTVGFGVFLPLYGPEVGIDDVGLVFLVNGVMVLSVRIFGARLPDRLGPVRAGSIASSTTAVALGTIALWHSATGVYVGAILLAVGAAFGYPAFLVLALRDVPESQRGSVVGTFSAFFDFASGTAGLLLGGIAAATNYRGAFATAAVFALAAFVLLRSGFVGDRHAPVTSPTPVDPALLEPPIPP
ncbi:MAG: MFS transporter [Acidimicrobiia bacterium]